MKSLMFPQDVIKLLERRYNQRSMDWLVAPTLKKNESFDDDSFRAAKTNDVQAVFFKLGLGQITENDFIKEPDVCRRWVETWLAWPQQKQILWQLKNWRSRGAGAQKIPISINIDSPDQIAQLLGMQITWARAQQRYEELVKTWPYIQAVPSGLKAIFFNYEDAEFASLLKFALWLRQNPISDQYLRQVPVPGIDTKWLEMHLTALCQLLSIIGFEGDLTKGSVKYLGLKLPPDLVRVKLLDQNLRTQMRGLSDITMPLDELEILQLDLKSVIYVENLQTFLSFDDLPRTAAIWSGGYAVKGISPNFAPDANLYYWGDIDTHGFAILNQARKLRPNLQSILMDEATLQNFKEQWSFEESPSKLIDGNHLNAAENRLLQHLQSQKFGVNVRLEQERVAWDYAWSLICRALN